MHTVFEHEVFDDFVATDQQGRMLDRLNEQNPPGLIKIIRNNRLRATQHVGVLRLGNATLQILPKIYRTQDATDEARCHHATKNLLVLLSYVLDLPLLAHHAATLQQQPHDWIELLTRIFATELKKYLHAAPHRAYHTFDDDLPLLRGKLRIADQLRRPDRQHRFACTFDEFSLDNPLNQVFRFVVERLFSVTSSSANRTLLGDLRDTLDPVTLLHHLTPKQADPSRLITRLNRPYGPILELARLFLSNQTPHLTHGHLDAFNFLFDMNTLFESFVAGFLKNHREQILADTPFANCTLAPQSLGHRHHLATDPENRKHFQLIPDLAFHSPQGTYPLLLDTKYKRLDPHHRRLDIAPADFYQTFAYAHRYSAPRVLLLYPQTADMPEPLQKSFTLDDTSITITTATINLTCDLTTSRGRAALVTEFRSIFASQAYGAPISATVH